MFGTGSSNRTYFKVANGSIVLSKDAEYRDSLEKFRDVAIKIAERTNKAGRTVVEAFFGSFTGKLVSIELTSFTYEKSEIENWNVLFEGLDGNEYVWSVQKDSYVFQSFINCLLSVPETENFNNVEISAYTTKSGGTGLGVKVNGKAAQWKYDKDSNVIPASKPILMANGQPFKENGFTKYDHSERTEFLSKLVQEINSRLLTDNGQPDLPAEPSASDEVPF